MIAVFQEVQAETVTKGMTARFFLYVRETAGLLAGALQQHVRTLGGTRVWPPFPDEEVHHASQRVTLGRVMKCLAGFRQQSLVFEEIEACLDGTIEVLGVADLEIIRSTFVVADAGEMSHDLARCDGPR